MSPSNTMRALVLQDPSTPISLETRPIPDALPGTAVVKILATSISPNTRKVLSGKLGLRLPPLPFTLSGASIGRIHGLGSDATALTAGQLVFVDYHVSARDDPSVSVLQGYIGTPTPAGNKLGAACQDGGTMAEYARSPLENVYPLNESLLVEHLGYSFAEMTTLGEAFVVAGGLFDPLEITAGDRLIVAPATGRFGGTAVQVALSIGCRVIAAGRNEEALEFMAAAFRGTGRLSTVKLTGDAEVDCAALRQAAGGDGADAYFDWSPPQATGTTHVAACINALRFGGRCALMGAILGKIEIDYRSVVGNNIRIQGRYMFEREHALQVIKMVESGLLRIGEAGVSGFKVRGRFGLADAEKAFDASDSQSGWGSVVVLEP